jgi:predicted metalloprotease with PDZ domain
MAPKIRTIAVAALAAALVFACTSTTEAQIRLRLRPRVHVAPPVVVTSPVISQPTPFLGFSSYFDGVAEQVTAVQYGTAAWRMGLEPGDRILSVNGIPLRYHGHGEQLVRSAAYRGQLTMAIRDRRTGLVTHRRVALSSQPVILGSSYVVHKRSRPSLNILRRFPR